MSLHTGSRHVEQERTDVSGGGGGMFTMMGSSDVAVNPLGRIIRAMLPTAATTDGSSSTMGTT